MINLVLDPGTENERTVSQKVVRGDMVLTPFDMHGYETYMDPEGKQLYDKDSAEALPDVHIHTYYLIKVE